jgi:MFS family permease
MGMGSFIKYGKWKLLLATNLFVIAGCGITLIANPIAIIIGRFFYGFASGSFSCLVPAYVAELTPKELRGPYGTIH